MMIDPTWQFPIMVIVATLAAGGLGVHACYSSKREGKKIDALREEQYQLERKLRQLQAASSTERSE